MTEREGIMCGGCGETKSSKRCINCLHDFGTPESAWVKKYHAPHTYQAIDEGDTDTSLLAK